VELEEGVQRHRAIVPGREERTFAGGYVCPWTRRTPSL
jgi:hypothetical protein